MKKLIFFFIQISKTHLKMQYIKQNVYEYKAKFEERSILFRSEIDIFDIYFKTVQRKF